MECNNNEKILWKVIDNIGHLILNGPPSNNMSVEFFSKLDQLINKVINKANVKSIIIYGNGRHFSSGAELDDLLLRMDHETKKNRDGRIVEYPKFLNLNNKTFTFFDNLSIPVIAAIRGVCIGSALELALSCHIRVCGKVSLLGLPEATFNLMPGCGGTQRLPALIGLAKSMEFILQDTNLSAEEALNLGLVDLVVPNREIIYFAVELVKHIGDDYRRENIKDYIKMFSL